MAGMAATAGAMDEDRIIRDYFAPLARKAPGAFALRDDAALLKPPPGADLVITMDTILAGVHVLEETAPGDLAWKALAVNLSDLAAKGAVPLHYLMSLALPAPPDAAWLEAFAGALQACQERHGLVLLGGDTVRTRGPLAITITAMGSVPQGAMVRRGAGQPGDVLYVSGSIGDAALGLALARGDEEARGWGLGEAERAHLLARYRRPEPRTALASAVQIHARAALDVSDGLVRDLGRLAGTSGCGARVEAGRVPLSMAAQAVVRRAPSRLADCLTGGDDYEILAAVPAEKARAFEAAAADCAVPVTAIGALCEAGDGVRVLDRSGMPMRFARSGYTHF